MKRISIRLSLPIVAPLVDVLRGTGESLQHGLAAPLRIEDLDPDFRESWTDELVEAQRQETALLLGLFDDEFFSTGVINIDEEQADAVLRACAAQRLHLRRNGLRKVTDEVLESGMVSPDSLPEKERLALLAYIFLATLQELLINQFDGTSSPA
jgi:hypothetical protein